MCAATVITAGVPSSKKRYQTAAERRAIGLNLFEHQMVPKPTTKPCLWTGKPHEMPELIFGCKSSTISKTITCPPGTALGAMEADAIASTLSVLNESNWGYPIDYTAILIPYHHPDFEEHRQHFSVVRGDCVDLMPVDPRIVFAAPDSDFIYGAIASQPGSDLAEFVVEYDRASMSVGPPHLGRMHARDPAHMMRYSELHIIVGMPGIHDRISETQCGEETYATAIASGGTEPAMFGLFDTSSTMGFTLPSHPYLPSLRARFGNVTSAIIAPAERGRVMAMRMDLFDALVSKNKAACVLMFVASTPMVPIVPAELQQCLVQSITTEFSKPDLVVLDPFDSVDALIATGKITYNATDTINRILVWSGIRGSTTTTTTAVAITPGNSGDCMTMIENLINVDCIYSHVVLQTYIVAWIMDKSVRRDVPAMVSLSSCLRPVGLGYDNQRLCQMSIFTLYF